MDRLSNMPDNIVESILETLPIRDAVRTCILSKKWSQRWEAVSRLHLDNVLYDTMYRRWKPPSITYVSLVKHIMLQHHGTLTEFEFYIPEGNRQNRADINLIIRCALRNGVRELSIEAVGIIPHVLSSFFFTEAVQLTQLTLSNCEFKPPLYFKGFPKLKVLDLTSVWCPNLDRLSTFISSCQELRKVRLDILNDLNQHLVVSAAKVEDLEIVGRFRSVSLKGIQDLERLCIYLVELCHDFEKDMPCKDYMYHTFSKLRKIKYLELGGYIFNLLAAEKLPTKLSPGLDHLKTFVAASIDLNRVKELQCLLCLIRSSPNLQKFQVKLFREIDSDGEETDSDADPLLLTETQTYGDCSFHHLKIIQIRNMMIAKSELKFVEFLLRCSPALEIMSVQFESELDEHAKLTAVSELKQYCCAPKAYLCIESN